MTNLLLLSNKRYHTDFRKYLMQAAMQAGGRALHVYCAEQTIISDDSGELDCFAPALDQAVIFGLIRKKLGAGKTIVLTGLGGSEAIIATQIQNSLDDAIFVYDVYDDLIFNATGFDRANRMLQDSIWRCRCEHEIILAASLQKRYPRAFQLDNASHLKPKTALKRADSNSFIYIGSIDDRVDFTWLEALAAHDVKLSIYGRIHESAPHAQRLLDAILERYRNVEFHGGYDNDDLPSIFENFRVGLLPYKVDHPLTDHINPDKLYHYLNVGLEVLAAPIPQAVGLASNVHLITANGPWTKVITEVFEAPRRMNWSAEDHSWNRRWSDLLNYMDMFFLARLI